MVCKAVFCLQRSWESPSEMAVVECDFQNNIYPSNAPKERAKIYVLCLNVYGCLQGVHTDDQSKNHQMHGRWDVGRENSPGSKPDQTQLLRDFSRRNLQPLVCPLHCLGEDPCWLRSEGPHYVELWAAAFPLDVPTLPGHLTHSCPQTPVQQMP